MQVNDASHDAWVVVHLYADPVPACEAVDAAMVVLARKFPAVKWVRACGARNVERWPDRNCPALFLYHGGETRHQQIGVAEMGGSKLTADDLEWFVAQRGVLETELECDPRKALRGRVNITRSSESDRIRSRQNFFDEDDENGEGDG